MAVRLASVCLGALLLLSGQFTHGQNPLTPTRALERADKFYDDDRLLQAEPLYQQALAGTPAEHRRASDRLLTLYARLGRYDRAIQRGRSYRIWLEKRNDHARLRYLALQMGEYYLHLGHARTARTELEASLAKGPNPLRPVPRVIALTLLAQIARGQRDTNRARQLWDQVEPLARRCLEESSEVIPRLDRITCARCLAECYRWSKQAEQAIPRLTDLLNIHDRLKDATGKVETFRLLAERHVAQGKHEEAYRCLLDALRLHASSGWKDQLTAGDLCNELAEVCLPLRDTPAGEHWRKRAVAHYQAVMRDPTVGRPGRAGALAAYWKLHLLYQRTSQFTLALELGQSLERDSGLLLQPRLRSELATLQTVLGSYQRARELLGQALEALEAQSPLNLVELPRALHNLGVVEQALGQFDRAQALGMRVTKLYQEHELPDDVLLVETHNLLGTCLAQRGDYTAAITRYRAGVACSEAVGPSADRQQCNLLLNIALLHKAQGDHARALGACQKARKAYLRLNEPDGPALAAFDLAEATLHSAQGRIREAAALADRALERCRRFDIEQGILVTTARHYHALKALLDRRLPDARKSWEQVRTEQQTEKDSLLLPRTLNYLALTEELSGRPAEAEKLYRQALRLQEGKRAFPATHFITLWRLALLVDARDSSARAEARALIEKAIEVAEATRLRVHGDAQQRASYLAQFTTAFEQLVEWNIRDEDVDAAVVAVDRGRSRSLLDQLMAAGVDPLASIPGPAGEQLRKQEAELRRKVAGIRARAQLVPVDDLDEEAAKQLLAEMDRVQTDYAELWREIYSASPIYRGLTTKSASATALSTIRRRVLGQRTVLLVYHLGRKNAQLLLIGDSSERSEVFALQVSADLAKRIASPESASMSAAGTRGLVLRKRASGEKLPPAPEKPGTSEARVPLTAAVARALLDNYRVQVAHPEFAPTRGLRLRLRDSRKPMAVHRPELPGDVFLPVAVRKRLRELKPETIIIVPDGPLHGFPLEALLVSTEKAPRYVLDALPPIVYAPSVSALALLAERPQPARKGSPTLLSVANPSYPQTKSTGEVEGSKVVLGLAGELPLLPFTAIESRRIQAHFPREKVRVLEGDLATEKRVREALSGSHIVHLAAHGFADERFGNLFGAVALSPSKGGKDSTEDGFLSLHEIYRLPLSSCELAVLSACSTHVGPQPPLEAGVTLASGFLAAGARRVVASHWCVDDRSTAELMATFFGEATRANGGQEAYARALYRARQAVRKKAGWESPFYWAPFVLLGLPDVER